MARERKGDKTRLKEDIDPEVKEKLLTGDIWRTLLDGETDPMWNNEESVHKLWDKHKDFILNELRDNKTDYRVYPRVPSEEGYPSGTRPACWWKYEGHVRDEEENEFDYLRRNDLLFEGEKERYLKDLERYKQWQVGSLKEEEDKENNIIEFPKKEENE